jgi:hypothetical protein
VSGRTTKIYFCENIHLLQVYILSSALPHNSLLSIQAVGADDAMGAWAEVVASTAG